MHFWPGLPYLLGDAQGPKAVGRVQVQVALSLAQNLPLAFSFGIIYRRKQRVSPRFQWKGSERNEKIYAESGRWKARRDGGDRRIKRRGDERNSRRRRRRRRRRGEMVEKDNSGVRNALADFCRTSEFFQEERGGHLLFTLPPIAKLASRAQTGSSEANSLHII